MYVKFMEWIAKFLDIGSQLTMAISIQTHSKPILGYLVQIERFTQSIHRKKRSDIS